MGLREGTNCEDLSHLPTLHESGNPFTLSLPASAYVLQFSSGGHSDCVVGVSPDKDAIWTLGQYFYVHSIPSLTEMTIASDLHPLSTR